MNRWTLLWCLALAACDDAPPATPDGGPGFASPDSVDAGGNGFCSPQGGLGALGTPAYQASGTAKIDTDGNPSAQGHDATWSPNTSGKVNGVNVDSSKYAYVVMSKGQMLDSGVALGDWARVTNDATGKSTFARVEDVGPAGGVGEISQAAARQVGIDFLPSSATVGNPSVSVSAFSNTSSIQSDCP